MPVDNGVGHSTATIAKQASLGFFLNVHISICDAIAAKWRKPRCYYYVDMNAGCGRNEQEGCDGSPLVFLKAATALRMPYKAWFIEKEKRNTEDLEAALDHLPDWIICRGDHNDIVPEVIKEIPNYANGLFYTDPNGIPSFGLLSSISQIMRVSRMDILIRYAASGGKRAGYKLADCIAKIDKKFWLVQEPSSNDKWQWTFLLGTNWTKFPEMERIRFYRIDSDRGRAILDRLNYTKEELEERQQASFFTGVTPNTSSSQSLRP